MVVLPILSHATYQWGSRFADNKRGAFGLAIAYVLVDGEDDVAWDDDVEFVVERPGHIPFNCEVLVGYELWELLGDAGDVGWRKEVEEVGLVHHKVFLNLKIVFKFFEYLIEVRIEYWQISNPLMRYQTFNQ